MSHQTSHRRSLAAPESQILMDPTSRKPKPNPSATTAAVKNHRHHHPHPLPDPTIAAPPSTIQTISHRFSKLYTNNKKLISHSKPHPHPHPQPDPNLHKPNPSFSCTTLTKSSSLHHGRNGAVFSAEEKKIVEVSTKIKVRERDDLLKKPSFKKDPIKRSSFDEIDVEKGSKLMVDEEKIEGFQQEGRNSLSLSSIPPTVNNGGRRRSFCSSQVELADFLSCSGVKVVAVDMPPFMQIHAVNCARKAHDSLEKFTSKTLAFTLKKEFDGVYGPAWHCIIGTSFGSFVTHSVGGFMYFSMDQKLYILLFKTAVQRAE